MTTRTTRTRPVGQHSPTDCQDQSDNGALIGPVSVRLVGHHKNGNTRTESKVVRVVEPWPPTDLRLPDSIAAIECGRIVQGELFHEQPDNSRAARLQRILAGVKGLTTADQLQAPRSLGSVERLRPSDGLGNKQPL
jgi:hypothetical protein